MPGPGSNCAPASNPYVGYSGVDPLASLPEPGRTCRLPGSGAPDGARGGRPRRLEPVQGQHITLGARIQVIHADPVSPDRRAAGSSRTREPPASTASW
jgi:hypothetical protein